MEVLYAPDHSDPAQLARERRQAVRTRAGEDGDGFLYFPDGSRLWGIWGAAGIALRAPGLTGQPDQFLLTLRSDKVAQGGGTWALPGGARQLRENSFEAALREFHEEIDADPGPVHIQGEYRVDRGTQGLWSYTTVVADVSEAFPIRDFNWEHDAVRWFTADQLTQLPLFEPFAHALPYVWALWPDADPLPAGLA